MPSGSRREGGGPQRDEAGQAGHQGSELVNAKPWQMRYESGYSRRDCMVRAVPLTGAARTRLIWRRIRFPGTVERRGNRGGYYPRFARCGRGSPAIGDANMRVRLLVKKPEDL